MSGNKRHHNSYNRSPVSKRSNDGSVLNVRPCDYAGSFPSFQKPFVTGYFSLNPQRQFSVDLTELKYLSVPSDVEVSFDLNKGIEERVANDYWCDEKIDNIFNFILQSGWDLQSNELNTALADIVCWRGLLTKIMCTPYERNEGWIILATKWKGVIFLCEKETEEARIQRQNRTDKDRRFMAWGFKFEHYLTSDIPNGKPNGDEPLRGKPEFGVLFKTKLHNHRLLFGAEMDGVDKKTGVTSLKDLQEAEFIELKTSRVIQHDRQYQNFARYKLIKWWAQSFLVGIQRVLCGYRDDKGMVREIKEHKVSDLPKMAKKVWDPSVCMNFCNSFLSFVRTVVQEEHPTTVWKFVWNPSEKVTYTKIPDSSDLSFLPEWFISKSSSKMG